MTLWYESIQDRLHSWSVYRKKLDRLSLHDAVHAVNDFWWTAPISNQYYCQTLVDNWPDPWILIRDNTYDDIARALGMLYTIGLTRHNKEENNIELIGYRDREQSKEYNLVYLQDGLYMLNWDLEVRVNSKNELAHLEPVYRYSVDSLLGGV